MCQAEGLSDARYVFGTANPTKSYRVRVAVDFDAHRKVTRILVRGPRFPAMRGSTERIVYTSDSDYWRGSRCVRDGVMVVTGTIAGSGRPVDPPAAEADHQKR